MVNPVRGEVTLVVGGVELVMVATMDSLAQLQDALGDLTFDDLGQRLLGFHLRTVRVAIETFAVRGHDAEGKELSGAAAAKAIWGLIATSDRMRVTGALADLFAALRRDDGAGVDTEGKAGAPAS